MSKNHIRISPRRWQVVRRKTLEKDGYRCRNCGRAGRLEVDHIVPLQIDSSEKNIYSPEGLQTLCAVPCHRDKTLREIYKSLPPEVRAWESLVSELL